MLGAGFIIRQKAGGRSGKIHKIILTRLTRFINRQKEEEGGQKQTKPPITRISRIKKATEKHRGTQRMDRPGAALLVGFGFARSRNKPQFLRRASAYSNATKVAAANPNSRW